MPKNKITTPSYFLKRLRDDNFYACRVYDSFSKDDHRKWVILLNPKSDSLFITCIDKGEWPYRGMYELDDGGRKVPKNFFINTDSIDVIVKHLSEFKILPNKTLNNSYESRRTKSESKEFEKEETD